MCDQLPKYHCKIYKNDMTSKILQSNDEKHWDFAEKQLKTDLDLQERQILIQQS